MQAMHAVPPQPDSLPVLEERAEILRHEAVNGEYRLMQVAAPRSGAARPRGSVLPPAVPAGRCAQNPSFAAR